MASIDKASIGVTVAVVAIALGIVFMGDSIQSSPTPAPTTSVPVAQPAADEPKTQTDPFAELASEVRDGAEEMRTEVEEAAEEMRTEVEEAAEEMGTEVEEAAEEMEAEVEEAVEEMEAEVEEMEVPSEPQTFNVDMPAGTAVPGCEETNECYIPASITINVGDTVVWMNSDTAAHTVTAGSPAEGPSGVFDSSLVLGGAEYSFTFEEAGSYDYFCMVHPWMVGDVQVN